MNGRASPKGLIRAAGGVVWRPRRDAPGDDPTEGDDAAVGRQAGSEAVEVLVVRRGRYDDWSLPKGKLHAGERHREAARREVLEETGVDCELGPKLGSVRYDTLLGPKRVRWWAMTPRAGETTLRAADPGEVADVEWLAFPDAWQRVTYATDREVLRRFVARVLGT